MTDAGFPLDPPKVLLAGDWHSNTPRAIDLIRVARAKGCTVVLQLGDFGFWVPEPRTANHLDRIDAACVENDVTVLWVDGNHECHPVLNGIPLEPEGFRRIRSRIIHLPRGFRWTWHGEVWLALGGAHSVDTFMRKEGVSVWQEEHISEGDARRAAEGGHADVMVTHDCPDNVDIPNLSPGSFPAHEVARGEDHRQMLGSVVDEVQPFMLFHGHYHVRYTSTRPRPSGGDTMIVGLADDMSRLRDNLMVLDLRS